MKGSALFFTFCCLLYLCETEIKADVEPHEGIEDPDVYRNIGEIIADKGYPVEDHTVQTADGYLLSVQHIPYGRNGNSDENEKKVVLVIHGLLGDANTFFLNFPGQSLGYILPDNGYDAWFLNTRGTDYSKRHVTYNTRQRQFWDFSFDEVALYDIPDTIDYILEATGKEALYVIAYSQGTTASFAMLSDRPDYNDKVKLFIALAPVTYIAHSTSSFRPFVPFKYTLRFLNDLFTHGEVLPDNPLLKVLRAAFCSENNLEICEDIVYSFGGVDETQLNKTRIDIYVSIFVSSSSSKSIVHYAQLVESKASRKYDYRQHRNLKYYHQEEPPDYETSRITTPVALFWSSNDIIADPTDVDILRGNLNSLVFDYHIPYPYNHVDYVLAKNSVELVCEPVLQLLAEY